VPYYLLFYETVDNYAEKRAPYREQHLERARDAQARGELLLAGALADPADGAVLVFRTPTQAAVEDFAQRDPYVQNGLIKAWRVRPWTVVIGNDPSEPGPIPPPAGR
jgi:uncharacterized protein YciI